jgi:hypothetical protein
MFGCWEGGESVREPTGSCHHAEGRYVPVGGAVEEDVRGEDGEVWDGWVVGVGDLALEFEAVLRVAGDGGQVRECDGWRGLVGSHGWALDLGRLEVVAVAEILFGEVEEVVESISNAREGATHPEEGVGLSDDGRSFGGDLRVIVGDVVEEGEDDLLIVAGDGVLREGWVWGRFGRHASMLSHGRGGPNPDGLALTW